MARPVTVGEARARATKLVDRERRRWATLDDAGVTAMILVLPLHPPNEREALKDSRAASDWADSWRGVGDEAGGNGITVTWVERQWPSLGRQRLPERLTVTGAEAVAGFAGRTVLAQWRILRERSQQLLIAFGWSEALAAAIHRHGTAIERLAVADFALLMEVVAWLREHPVSGYRLRQVPIPGMHTKWLGSRRALVEALHAAVTGEESLGLLPPPETLRVRFLDPALRPGGLTDVAAPLAELDALSIRPATVIVCENLESVLALPDLTGTVAIHGAGYAIPVHRIGWAARASVLYWGDLDADGFAILNRLRANGVDARSVLMDSGTLLGYRELWVPDPNGVRPRELPHLTSSEQQTLDLIAAEGGVRLEQERLPWPQVLATLDAVVSAGYTSRFLGVALRPAASVNPSGKGL